MANGLDPGSNPYSPGAGMRPPVLAGREDDLADLEQLLGRVSLGYVDPPRLVEGVRGVGKTVLLLTLRDLARARGAAAVHVQARRDTGVLGGLAWELDLELRRHQSAAARVAAARRALSALNVTFAGTGFGATRAPDAATSGDLAVDVRSALEAVCDALGPATGLVLTLDELQELRGDELSALLVALHRAAGDGLPIATVVAGLPGTLVLAARTESFAERMFVTRTLGPLRRAAAETAITQPALDAGGVRWSSTALGLVVGEAAGYPYFLQHFASSTWNAASGAHITVADARRGLESSEAILRESLVRARLERASPRERAYVEALASLGPGAHATSAVAAQMGSTSSGVASARQRLIEAGVVHAPAYGQVAFTLPLFDRYVRSA